MPHNFEYSKKALKESGFTVIEECIRGVYRIYPSDCQLSVGLLYSDGRYDPHNTSKQKMKKYHEKIKEMGIAQDC
jgi:hypothetical protein